MSAAIIVALVGWLVTGLGWFVSQRNQQRLFLHQIRNAARIEVLKSLETEQAVLRHLSVFAIDLDVAYRVGQLADQPEEKWNAFIEEYQKIDAEADGQWGFVLEQYEVLFPETASCRRALLARSGRLQLAVGDFFHRIYDATTRDANLSRIQPIIDALDDQQMLFENLIIHFQNVTIGKVVGRTVAFRTPTNPAVPRIIMRKGELAIADGSGNSLDESSILVQG